MFELFGSTIWGWIWGTPVWSLKHDKIRNEKYRFWWRKVFIWHQITKFKIQQFHWKWALTSSINNLKLSIAKLAQIFDHWQQYELRLGKNQPLILKNAHWKPWVGKQKQRVNLDWASQTVWKLEQNASTSKRNLTIKD